MNTKQNKKMTETKIKKVPLCNNLLSLLWGDLKTQKQHCKGLLQNQRLFNLKLDEAFDFAGVPQAADVDKSKIENRFKYEKVNHIGHRVESKFPVLFELCSYDNEFQKNLSLAVVFENLNIDSSTANCKHVLLHFNVNNDIPRFTFKFFDLKNNTDVTDKVSNSYKNF